LTELTRAQRLAEAILADHVRPTTSHNIVPCFVCGHTFVYHGRRGELNGRFCSLRCQDCYDAGNEPIGEETIYRWRDGKPMRKGAKAFYIDCANCRKKFESLGIRCCSTECERSYCERQENLAVMAEAGIEPAAKRKCVGPGCDASIPNWKKGRRVSKAVRFCSEKCSKRARRAAA
jgi:hypothetical protein